MTRLRAYFVTHYAKTAVTTVVAARTTKEAVQKDADGDYIDAGWAGEAFPITQGRARRAPEYDALAGRSHFLRYGSRGEPVLAAPPEPDLDEEERP